MPLLHLIDYKLHILWSICGCHYQIWSISNYTLYCHLVNAKNIDWLISMNTLYGHLLLPLHNCIVFKFYEFWNVFLWKALQNTSENTNLSNRFFFLASPPSTPMVWDTMGKERRGGCRPQARSNLRRWARNPSPHLYPPWYGPAPLPALWMWVLVWCSLFFHSFYNDFSGFWFEMLAG